MHTSMHTQDRAEPPSELAVEFGRLDEGMKAALRSAVWRPRWGRYRLAKPTLAVRNRFERRGLVDRSFWLTARGVELRELVLAEYARQVADAFAKAGDR